jgi:hypothetical protein
MPYPANESDAARQMMPMRDTIKPQFIPDDWNAIGAVMSYWDGSYRWPAAQEQRFARVIRLTVTGDIAAAPHARGIDIERYDATVLQAPGWVDAREAAGHDDATVYCSRDTLRPLYRQLGPRRPRLIIATLDSYPWSPAELAANCQADFAVTIEPDWIWGIQIYPGNETSPWDTTNVWGAKDFWDPQTAAEDAG